MPSSPSAATLTGMDGLTLTFLSSAPLSPRACAVACAGAAMMGQGARLMAQTLREAQQAQQQELEDLHVWNGSRMVPAHPRAPRQGLRHALGGVLPVAGAAIAAQVLMPDS